MKKVCTKCIVAALLLSFGISAGLPAAAAEVQPAQIVVAAEAVQNTTQKKAKQYFANYPSDKHVVSVERFLEVLGSEEKNCVIDLRSEEDYAKGHIESAVNIPYGTAVADALEQIPNDVPVYVYCYSGQTASQTVALLNLAGKNAYNVSGGFDNGISKAENAAELFTKKESVLEEGSYPVEKELQQEIREYYQTATENGKFNAVVEQVKECHEKGQPVLVGTVSIETSERLSALLKRHGIKHQVLNAKYHEKEAEIVAQAGQYGAVTIATNMAGRGTDIMLGGNAEYLAKNQMRKEGYYEELIVEATGFGDTDNEEIIEARKRFTELSKEFKEKLRPEAEKVKEAGGLFIVGTERHESRRIDNQLRGRSGRQGDPGCSRFYLSLEDDLMRLFGGDRINAMMDSLKIDEDMPIENKILTNTIENAQSKIEGRNFGIRKNVLQFDDVMNKQREIIYAQRNKVLDGENLKDSVLSMMDETVDSAIAMYMPEGVEPEHWNMEGFRNYFIGIIAGDLLEVEEKDLKDLDKKALAEQMKEKVHEVYAKREEELGENITRELERVVLLKEVDTKWMDHIDAMDELKKGIYLRSYGQKDPVVEYRIEGFDMFDEMIAGIREETVKILLLAPFRKPAAGQVQEAPKREQVAKPTATSSDGTVAPATIKRQGKKVGRNDPCPCGSGKKYKNCCGRQ